jgi:hypothetical protein
MDPGPNRVIEFDKRTSTVTALAVSTDAPLEATVPGEKLVWLEQPWLASRPGPSAVRWRERANGVASRVLVESGRLGGLNVEGDDVYVLRVGPAADGGGIVHASLSSARDPTTIASTDLPYNGWNTLALALDTTHFYWLAADVTETRARIMKRARCAGESVELGTPFAAFRIVPFGARLYVTTYVGVWSVAK